MENIINYHQNHRTVIYDESTKINSNYLDYFLKTRKKLRRAE